MPELDEAAHPRDVHGQALANLHAERLRREIRRLPAPQRDAILLREFAGLSYEELARELGVTRPAVHSLLVRARATLRMRLRPEFAAFNLAGLVAAVRRAIGFLGWRAGAALDGDQGRGGHARRRGRSAAGSWPSAS